MNLAELAAVVSDEEKAFRLVESMIWSAGPECPHCRSNRVNRLAPQRTKPSKKHPEGKPVHGLWKCYECRKQFTIRVGTIFEDSPIPLGKWSFFDEFFRSKALRDEMKQNPEFGDQFCRWVGNAILQHGAEVLSSQRCSR